jgi:chromosome segregation ATPase
LSEKQKELDNLKELLNGHVKTESKDEGEGEPLTKEQLEIITSFNETIHKLEEEKTELFNQLNELRFNYKSDVAAYEERLLNVASDDKQKSQTIAVDHQNAKLLEDKFMKVMKDNANLKEKNQELEHIILQLQFETETIGNFISGFEYLKDGIVLFLWNN